MAVQYSIEVLKDNREKLREAVETIDKGAYEGTTESVKRLRTKFTHEIRDLDYSIEVLEDHYMSYDE